MTMGSPIFRDFIPSTDAIHVERVKRAGAIVIGKTNAPEFGLGSQTYNPVFGTTLNPYDLTRTPGGSSGGACVSLALRMLPVADGTDSGGSLRNPAAWCNVFGFRSSYGRVPSDRLTVLLPRSAFRGRSPVPFPILRCCCRYRLAMTHACLCPTVRTPPSLPDL